MLDEAGSGSDAGVLVLNAAVGAYPHTAALDAVIVGNDGPDDPGLRTVFPDLAAAGAAFHRRHGFVPVNHLLTVRRDVADGRPDAVAALVRMFRDAAAAAPGGSTMPMGRATLQPAIDLALRYAADQGLLCRTLGPDEVWDGLPLCAATKENEV